MEIIIDEILALDDNFNLNEQYNPKKKLYYQQKI